MSQSKVMYGFAVYISEEAVRQSAVLKCKPESISRVHLSWFSQKYNSGYIIEIRRWHFKLWLKWQFTYLSVWHPIMQLHCPKWLCKMTPLSQTSLLTIFSYMCSPSLRYSACAYEHFMYYGSSMVFCKNKHRCPAGDRTRSLISIYLAPSLFGFILNNIRTLLHYKQLASISVFLKLQHIAKTS